MNQREKCKRIQEKESCNISVVWCDAGERRGPRVGAAQEGAAPLGFPHSGRSSTPTMEEPRRELSCPSPPVLMEISTDAGTGALTQVLNNTLPYSIFTLLK